MCTKCYGFNVLPRMRDQRHLDKFSFKSWVKTASKAETGASIELWPQLGRCGLLTHWSLHCSAHKCRSEIVKSRVPYNPKLVLMAKYHILSDKTIPMSSCHKICVQWELLLLSFISYLDRCRFKSVRSFFLLSRAALPTSTNSWDKNALPVSGPHRFTNIIWPIAITFMSL